MYKCKVIHRRIFTNSRSQIGEYVQMQGHTWENIYKCKVTHRRIRTNARSHIEEYVQIQGHT